MPNKYQILQLDIGKGNGVTTEYRLYSNGIVWEYRITDQGATPMRKIIGQEAADMITQADLPLSAGPSKVQL
jgi:hypothetical protein